MTKQVNKSKEFKLDALYLLQEVKSISEISKNLGISVNTLCTWRRRYQIDGDKVVQGSGIRLLDNKQQEKLRRLKKEVSVLKMERDILKKVLSIFY